MFLELKKKECVFMLVQTKHVLPPVGAIFIPRNYFELDCKILAWKTNKVTECFRR